MSAKRKIESRVVKAYCAKDGKLVMVSTRFLSTLMHADDATTRGTNADLPYSALRIWQQSTHDDAIQIDYNLNTNSVWSIAVIAMTLFPTIVSPTIFPSFLKERMRHWI